MRNWIFVVFVFCTTALFAQPETAQTEIINGKKHYVHFVQTGNTLWGLHKTYNVSVEEIVKANPGVEKGLIEGQKIVIPVPVQTVTHVVANKETLYGISKKYGVKMEDIILANPGVENGLNVGQALKIPGVEPDKVTNSDIPVKEDKNGKNVDSLNKVKQFTISFSDTVITHVVLDHETLYSISKRFMVPVEELQKLNGLRNTKIKPGDKLKIPVKKEKIETVTIRKVENIEKKKVDSTLLFPKKKNYKIAILLPFFLDRGEGSSEHISNLATEFYMGAKLAIDSLERLGLHAEVYVYDSRNDTLSVKKILAKPEFNGMDLVFGPMFPENVDIVARWCKENNVRMICPAVCNSGILKENPFVYNAIPSDATLMKGLAEFTLKNNSQNQIILIKSPSEKDQILYDSYRSAFLTPSFSSTRPKLIEASMDNFASFIKKGVKVILVFPSNEKSQVVKFMNSLNSASQKLNSDNIFVYGTKDWVNFDEVKPHFRNKFHFHFASPNDLNYKYAQTEKLHRKYRSAYNSDMTKMSIQGFDVMFYFCSEFLLNQKSKQLVMNDFDLNQKGNGNGFENEHYFILEQIDFELVNVENQ